MATRQISIPVWYLPDGVTPTAVRIDFLLVDASSVPMSGIVGTEQILSRVHVLTANAIQLISLTTTDTISPENYYLCTIYGPDLEEQFTFQIADEPGTIEFVDLRAAGAPIDPADPIYSRLLPATADNVNDVIYWDGDGWVTGSLPATIDWTMDQDPNDIHEANITQLSVTQHESAITHDNLGGVGANEHIDWTQDQGGAAYVDPGNYVGGVTSFNTRTGAVVPASGDYDADGITETASNKVMTAAERTKLTGIEAAATADQTGAEIKAAYEGEADTNAFTDAEQAKLAAIEAAATDDLTGAEIKALYEAELDTNAFTDTEQTKLTGIEVNATGDQTGAEIKSLYEAEADTNAFTDAEQTKLTGIETTATADQTDAEIETAYNNEVAQISTAEIEAGTGTDDRRLTPAKLKEFTDYHSYPDVAGEPNGFVDIDDVVLGWTDGTRTMTIDPAVTSFSFWSNGTLFTKSAQESIQITDAEGGHYIYYDGAGALQVSTSFDESYILQYAMVAYVYWDATNDRAIPDLITELHGMSMSPATHLYLHNTQGTKYETGLQPTIDSTGDGDTDSHAQFSVTAGYIWDEDVRHLIASKTLTGSFYKLWKDGANGDWRMSTTADAGLVENTGTGRAAWNEFTGGSWQLTEVTDNEFVLAHIVAIPGLTESWGVIVGQADYSSIPDAEQGAATELNTLGLVGWPWTEACFVATVILQTGDTYTNTWKSRVEPVDSGGDFIDWRAAGTGSGGSGGSGGTVEHNSTTGLQGGTTDEYYHLTSAEQTKLTGIETAATADQSDAEIETAYNNQVAIVSQAAAEAGTDTTATRWTAQRVSQAIAALDPGGSVAHNNTTGLQGGTTDEYYHLTSAEQTKLTGIETTATADQTDAEIETAYNNQVAVVSQAVAEAGTDTAAARWTPQRVAQAIAALGGSGGGSLTLTASAPTTADVTAEDGKHYVVDASGMTADRTFLLPAPSAAGERIRVTLETADDTYALLIKASATSIQGGTAGAEWSRLVVDNEAVEFLSSSTSNWLVVYDGRIPLKGVYTEDTSTQTLGTTGEEAVVLSDIDLNRGMTMSAGTITPRRTGRYKVNFHSNWAKDTLDAQMVYAAAFVSTTKVLQSPMVTHDATNAVDNAGAQVIGEVDWTLGDGDFNVKARAEGGASPWPTLVVSPQPQFIVEEDLKTAGGSVIAGGGGGGGGGLTFQADTVTTSNLSATEDYHHVATIAGMTANRDFVLPAPSEAGKSLKVTIADGDDDYELVIKGTTGVSINSGTAATEWSRLFMPGESVEFVSTSTSNWLIVEDGRKPQYAVAEIDADQSMTNATREFMDLDQASRDNANIHDTVNGDLRPRRAGLYELSISALMFTDHTSRDIMQIVSWSVDSGTTHNSGPYITHPGGLSQGKGLNSKLLCDYDPAVSTSIKIYAYGKSSLAAPTLKASSTAYDTRVVIKEVFE